MLIAIFASIRDSVRRRFGRPHTANTATSEAEEAEELYRHNDAEARVTGRTLGDSNAVRAFGKGRPR